MRATRNDLPILFGAEPATIRGVNWGGLRSLVVSSPAGTDFGPLFKGLPDDRCPCPHWGYMVKGRLRMSYADGDEVLQAGDLFYMPPGHSGVAEEDVQFVEFSPPDEHEAVLEVLRRNAANSSST